MPGRNSTVWLIAGAAVLAVAAGRVVLALRPHHRAETASTTAADRGLKLEMSRGAARADASKPLRCFVEGRFIGLLTLSACAKRNGAEAGALSVGVDRTGAATAGENLQLQPLNVAPPETARLATNALEPPVAPRLPTLDRVSDEPPSDGSGAADCLRYGEGGWRPVASATPLTACVRKLYEGHCVQPGDALYGRWADQTVRLFAGRVEISGDNSNFHTLVEQDADCSVPPFEVTRR